MAQITGYPSGFGLGDTSARVNTTGAPPVPLGTVGYDSSGNEYRFVRAGGTINAAEQVRVTASATPFDAVVVTGGNNLALAGVATAGFVANDCGWIMRNGVTAMKTAGAVAVDTPQTTGAAGVGANAAAADTGNAVAWTLVNSASPQTCLVVGV